MSKARESEEMNKKRSEDQAMKEEVTSLHQESDLDGKSAAASSEKPFDPKEQVHNSQEQTASPTAASETSHDPAESESPAEQEQLEGGQQSENMDAMVLASPVDSGGNAEEESSQIQTADEASSELKPSDEEAAEVKEASEATREAYRKAAKEERQQLKVRLIPIWLRLVLLVVLSVIALCVGAMIGYGVIGKGNPLDVFHFETWKHIRDIVTKGT
ncbi:hypothetical protein GCM10011391_03390 [Pullulanibacillus camelliae]|uniref:DNA-directed RNA polymerase subunit beta n=1 Tax=Pullulanibacillus camelliae TaxID=1707096 RepID=A0A8J2YA27_9BACL|nr:DNA-directed RNA polymerase subunit beta [Pullulanibacillus camelliae]GGE28195.1 hypothetical protein GCM10011391_03390 [Pullulanibacillus camelliae]